MTSCTYSRYNSRESEFTYLSGMSNAFENGDIQVHAFRKFVSRKFVRTKPARTSENAFLEQGIKVAIIIRLCAQKETDPVIWKRMTNKLH